MIIAPRSPPLIRTSALRTRGMTAWEIEQAVTEGRLWRVVRGWYAEPGTDPELIRAMRLGGRLGCVSAIRCYGGWVPPDAGMHVAMPISASGRRIRQAADGAIHDVTFHWRSKGPKQEWSTGLSPLALAIGHAVECQPAHFAVAILDSLLHRRLTTRSALDGVVRGLPTHHRALLRQVDGRSEEGIESIVRFRLAEAGISAEPQVVVPDIGRVDLLLDGWLAIELDGRATHAQQSAFTSDRRRTALLVQRGLDVLHFSYSQVVYDWPLVLDTVRSILGRSPR